MVRSLFYLLLITGPVFAQERVTSPDGRLALTFSLETIDGRDVHITECILRQLCSASWDSVAKSRVFRRGRAASVIGGCPQDAFIGVEAVGRLLFDLGEARPGDHAEISANRGHHLFGDLVLHCEDAGRG